MYLQKNILAEKFRETFSARNNVQVVHLENRLYTVIEGNF